MITNPKVIMLDEPTSGLDSTSAYRVMKLMQNEARNGKCVIATIHMPSSETFMLFDKIMLLSEGHSIYHGTV
jgi:ABC-type multidrug transport system ATPase subunit